jgi:hypothetical protein
MIMSEKIPSIAVLAVVFPDGTPLTLGEIGPPLLPRSGAKSSFIEARVFSSHEGVTLIDGK